MGIRDVNARRSWALIGDGVWVPEASVPVPLPGVWIHGLMHSVPTIMQGIKTLKRLCVMTLAK